MLIPPLNDSSYENVKLIKNITDYLAIANKACPLVPPSNIVKDFEEKPRGIRVQHPSFCLLRFIGIFLAPHLGAISFC